MGKTILLFGIDGLGRFYNEMSFLNDLIEKGSIVNVDSMIPTDSAENWGSILHGVRPEVHGLN